MTTYVDTSTLLKLVIDEDGSERAEQIWREADGLTSASVIVVEGRAALVAAHRTRRIDAPQLTRARSTLHSLVELLTLVHVTRPLLDRAAELAEDEQLRAYDAVHLAAALVIEATLFTSADVALCAAASRRGLHVANPATR